jgi:uracil-DNA glycosylase family 4
MTTKNIELVEWYCNSGVTDVVSNTPRSYLKEQDIDIKNVEQVQKNISPNMNEPKNLSSRELADRCNTIAELKSAVENFSGCKLKETARNTVFSDGNKNADVMLIGEAPGANEDAKGIPFCGDSGQLLDKVLETIDLTRKNNLYITNSIFWRPPANRKPSDEELQACLPFVEKHIALISPKLLIIAGGVALYTLLGIATAISKYRQQILHYKNKYIEKEIPVAVIYHPSYLLRQPMQKRSAWQDMIFIKNFLDKT